MMLISESELESIRALPNPKARFQARKQNDELVEYMAELDGKAYFAMIPLEKWQALEYELLKHAEYNEARINCFIDLFNGMKRSNQVFKNALKA